MVTPARLVTAHQTQTRVSGFPIEIVFDRGDGGQPARKLLESGVYRVGVDPEKNRLDLFTAEVGQVAAR